MITDIYRIKTKNSVYEIQITDKGVSRCHKEGDDNWYQVKANTNDWVNRLFIGASFDVPGVVLTSVVSDYAHFVPSGKEKRVYEKPSTISGFFDDLTEHIKEQVTPQVVTVICGIDGCTVERVPGLPSHEGARMCKSGSIASGGARAHCSCDYCY